jgi:hypothetical protein
LDSAYLGIVPGQPAHQADNTLLRDFKTAKVILQILFQEDIRSKVNINLAISRLARKTLWTQTIPRLK